MPVTDADRQAAVDFLESWEPRPQTDIVKLARVFAAHREAAERAGAQAMQDRIVAWLRGDAASLNASEEPRDWKLAEAIGECADGIEQGEHAIDPPVSDQERA